jgi:hypothetical protein
MVDDTKRGLYGKYKIERLDGSSLPGGKHERCEYFVLDLEHDKHAKAALRAYAKSCAKEYPALARDLRDLMKRPERDCGCRSVEHSCGRFFAASRKPAFGRSKGIEDENPKGGLGFRGGDGESPPRE